MIVDGFGGIAGLNRLGAQTDARPMTGDVATLERTHAERMRALYGEVDRLEAARWMTTR